jgi:hypothetical protein
MVNGSINTTLDTNNDNGSVTDVPQSVNIICIDHCTTFDKCGDAVNIASESSVVQRR